MTRPGLRGLSAALLGATLLLAPPRAHAEDMVFVSTQMRPIEEAQKVRDTILKDAPAPVAYVTEDPPALPVRVKAEMQGGKHTISLIGALHGELQPLATMGALMTLDDLAARLKERGIPDEVMKLGQFGTGHQMYIPWMQATYLMVANRQALPYLPAGADINALTYDQLQAWAAAIQEKTGKRMLGFPAGPKGLMHRFFEGFLYPSYTGGVVVPFRSDDAEKMWTAFAGLWKTVNPNSTSYNFMQEPLLAGDVWIGFDHVARVLDALRQKPDDFVAFPAPAGPKGRGYMPVLAGLAVAKGAPDANGAMALIDYLAKPETQITTARAVGFFPVVKATLPPDLDPGLKLAVAAIAATGGAKDALPSLLPIGLGQKGGEFDKVFMDTFQLVVLRGQKPRAVLDRQGQEMQRILTETGAPCWAPDPPSQGACQVK
ncbi:ABC transporter substrate-binding protein [Limobrevibacterium gyesilva]|uniref:ABC transporter substrate-binding protein n=1 Tax=Limobrevibacterium gyesilva TaxID=2991712 RepID=A0AA41YNI1_9PROT|nr:ABC transporter substrate-binding protein [Limobrevibacterium gyesilva]MCW3475348.1 ABC transporter substrate-binding protein [Limobrevibacterium gyesilva]